MVAAWLLLTGCGTKETPPPYKNRDAQYQHQQAQKAIDSLDNDFKK